jgi:hypothetical protein
MRKKRGKKERNLKTQRIARAYKLTGKQNRRFEFSLSKAF